MGRGAPGMINLLSGQFHCGNSTNSSSSSSNQTSRDSFKHCLVFLSTWWMSFSLSLSPSLFYLLFFSVCLVPTRLRLSLGISDLTTGFNQPNPSVCVCLPVRVVAPTYSSTPLAHSPPMPLPHTHKQTNNQLLRVITTFWWYDILSFAPPHKILLFLLLNQVVVQKVQPFCDPSLYLLYLIIDLFLKEKKKKEMKINDPPTRHAHGLAGKTNDGRRVLAFKPLHFHLQTGHLRIHPNCLLHTWINNQPRRRREWK